MDTTTITPEIMTLVNEIHLGTICVMWGILMLGGALYNMYHARDFLPLVGSGKFDWRRFAVENSVRFVYCLVFFFLIAFAINWIPGAHESIGGLTGMQITMTGAGILAAGIGLTKWVFDGTNKKEFIPKQ